MPGDLPAPGCSHFPWKQDGQRGACPDVLEVPSEDGKLSSVLSICRRMSGGAWPWVWGDALVEVEIEFPFLGSGVLAFFGRAELPRRISAT